MNILDCEKKLNWFIKELESLTNLDCAKKKEAKAQRAENLAKVAAKLKLIDEQREEAFHACITLYYGWASDENLAKYDIAIVAMAALKSKMRVEEVANFVVKTGLGSDPERMIKMVNNTILCFAKDGPKYYKSFYNLYTCKTSTDLIHGEEFIKFVEKPYKRPVAKKKEERAL